MVFNSLSASVWGPDPHTFSQPFKGAPIDILGITIGKHNLYLFVVAMLITAALYGFFQHTRLGLAMRATAYDRGAAELMGVPTGLMLMMGWGLAAALGAAAGMLVAPIVVLTPNMMFFILLFGFAAAVLGGLDSAPGAILGGLIVGVMQNLTGVYLDDVVDFFRMPFEIKDSNQYRDIVAIGLILAVLAIRPRGILGRPLMQKV
jgi:branched-chain amino acid transport system permease protein